MSRLSRFLPVLALALAVASPGWATNHVVQVGDYFFNPANLTVQQGDSVTWENTAGDHGIDNYDTPSYFNFGPAPAPWTFTFVFSIPPATYHYRCPIHYTIMLGTITVQGAQSAPQPPEVVNEVELDQNYPNPFNSETVIRFALPFQSNVKLTVLNVLGQPVTDIFNGELGAGAHQFLFNAARLSSGMYFYRLQTPLATLTRKMYFVK